MNCSARIVLFVCLPLYSGALIPPSSHSTPAEVLQYRTRKKAEYRAAHRARERAMGGARARVQQTMEATPWPVESPAPAPLSRSDFRLVRAPEQSIAWLTGWLGCSVLALCGGWGWSRWRRSRR